MTEQTFDPHASLSLPDMLDQAKMKLAWHPFWKSIKGTPLESDLPVLMVEFVQAYLKRHEAVKTPAKEQPEERRAENGTGAQETGAARTEADKWAPGGDTSENNALTQGSDPKLASWAPPSEQPDDCREAFAAFLQKCGNWKAGHVVSNDGLEIWEAAWAASRLKRESGWLPYPGAVPRLYEGMSLSYPLLFHVKIPGADYVYQGFYNAENKCFYESGDDGKREFKDDVVGFMHYSLPPTADYRRWG